MNDAVVMGEETDAQPVELVQLWMLRILRRETGYRLLFRGKRFASPPVALFLGLEAWTEVGGNDADLDRKAIADLLAAREEVLESASARPRLAEPLAGNLAFLAGVFGLSETERDVLGFVVLARALLPLRCLMEHVCPLRRRGYAALAARALRLPPGVVADALAPEGVLMRSSILEEHDSAFDQIPWTLPLPGLQEALLDEPDGAARLLERLAPPAPAPTVGLGDFRHLAPGLAHVKALLESALEGKGRGVSVLLYGVPGAGKSELARVLGRELNAQVREIAATDRKGDTLEVSERVRALRLARAAHAHGRTLLVFDGAERLFRNAAFAKEHFADDHDPDGLAELLRPTGGAVILLARSLEGLDPDWTSRIDLVLRVRLPPRSERTRMVRRLCGKSVDAATVERLAACATLDPGTLRRAQHLADRISGDEPPRRRSAVLRDLAALALEARRLDGTKLYGPQHALPEVHSLDFLNVDVPLDTVAERLRDDPSCRLCLHGPSGTGKSAFGHWLAQQLDLPLVEKRASDLLDPYVGMTERNLARMFAEARFSGALLLLDEVDTFLRDRRLARQGWEVSKANEVLTQMERFDGVFVASTNLLETIDPAALRRFDLKVRFDFLRPDQAERLLAEHLRYLGLLPADRETSERVAELPNLTPGDFGNVARQHRHRRFADAVQFAEAVVAECRCKADGTRRRMGFGA